MKNTVLTALLVISLWLTGNSQWNVIPTNPTCWGTCDGRGTVTPPGGNFHFNWSNGDTGSIAHGLCAGAYYLTITDLALNPLDTLTFFLTDPTQLVVTTQATDVTCAGSMDGFINVVATGGTPPYTYVWSNGMVGQGAGNLPAGTYSLTVMDGNGCSASGIATVNEPLPMTVAVIDSDATCTGSDGSAVAVVTGGNGPYTYLWSNFTTTQMINGLPPGTYFVNITDMNGCTASGTATINASAGSTLSATVNNDTITCTHPTGQVQLTITNGIPLYNISWGDGMTQSSNSNVINHSYPIPGTYTIVYGDSSGCNNALTTVIANAAVAVNFNALHPACNAPNSGSLVAAASGGAPPYFYAWNTGATTNALSNLTAGTYIVTVTDSTGCSVAQTYTLATAASNISTYTTNTLASCVNGGMGNSTIHVSGGTPGYTYIWGTTPPQTTQTATNIAAGIYSYTVTDNAGCIVSGTTSVYFTSYSYYVYTQATAYPNCGTPNGSVTANAYGGATPYTYLWSNNQTTQTATALGQGSYAVTVTDAGGCTATGGGYLQSTCYNTISGHLYMDANSNCQYDNGETAVIYATVSATNGNQTYYDYVYSSGAYSIQVHDTGTFTISYNSANGYACYQPCGSTTLTTHFSGYNNTSAGNNFGFTSSSGFDFFLHPGWTSANPGFDKRYWIYYGNQSPTPYTGPATVTFKYDSNLTYLSSDPPLPAHNPTAHTLTWQVTGVDNWDRRGTCYFNVPPTVPAGYYLQSDFWITPNVGDCDSSNNHEHYSELMTSSMDPNEKEVSPAGPVYEEDSVLTYTIHFQNTGTDTTWFIILKDTLSAYLDPASVRNLASSHEYTEFSVSGTGVLTWLFNPIFLVDSATNEPASKGFVKFSIKKKGGLPIGTVINNKAAIYFDYNQPVITNTVASTLSEPTYIFEPRTNSNVKVEAFPNPFSQSTNIVVSGLDTKFDFALFDITGRKEMGINGIENNRFTLNRDALPAGVYFYKISTGKQQVAVGKLVVQ